MTTWPLVVGAVAAVAVLWLLWYLSQSGQLTRGELQRLAVERRVAAIASDYQFSFRPTSPASFDFRSFKSRMKSTGGFVRLDEPLGSFPALAAALLKGKKHEWFLFGYVRDDKVVGLWMNKGPDGSKVVPLLSIKEFVTSALRVGTTDVLEFHNHPNSNPRLYRTASASEQDEKSASLFGQEFAIRAIAFHAFVTERGMHHQYGSWIPNSRHPLVGFQSQADAANGVSRWSNFKLRRELGRPNHLSAMIARRNSSTNLTSQLAAPLKVVGRLAAPGHPPIAGTEVTHESARNS